jgi:alkylation response protein AidB-like acyl-CoA dehydrogenase
MTDPVIDDGADAFRAEARQWIKENFPASLEGQSALVAALNEGMEPTGDLLTWKRRLGANGWSAPTWPKVYGGGGLNSPQARILQQEMARGGAFNPLNIGMGLSMIGPTILDYGTEAQKQRHIPPIVRGEARWCVGYSEPNAGSDLASLRTRCEDGGDHWVVNGQKTWTSGAQWSHWCGCLVRTDPGARKHHGISFLLIDMRQPSVETRPIELIAGASPFCETFFTNTRADKDALLGELNKGWDVGKRLLQHERASQTGAFAGAAAEPLQNIARRYLEMDSHGRLADTDLRRRLTEHLMSAKAHALTLARAAAEARGNADPGNAASVLKNSATSVAQMRAELMRAIMGTQGLGWEGETYAPEELDAVRSWLGGKAMSIYGGSAEIQNNIVAKRILGLPETTQQG